MYLMACYFNKSKTYEKVAYYIPSQHVRVYNTRPGQTKADGAVIGVLQGRLALRNNFKMSSLYGNIFCKTFPFIIRQSW